VALSGRAEEIVRVSIIEGLCLVAIGAAMVELHDSQRFARSGFSPAALATAAKPAAGAGETWGAPDTPSVVSAPASR
jgi:hypothetical protein